MDDLSEQLNALLQSPDTMKKLQGLLSSLGDDGKAPASPSGDAPDLNALLTGLLPDSPPAKPPAAPVPPPAKPASSGGGGIEMLLPLLPLLSGLGSGSGGAGSGGMAKLLPLLGGLRPEDENTALLRALRPYLHGEREKRLDQAIQMMQLAGLLPLLSGGKSLL